MHGREKRQALRILLAQGVLTAVLATGALLASGVAAYSALFGGAIATTGTAVLAVGVFGRYSARRPDTLTLRLYAGELSRLLAVGAMFAAVFILVQPIDVIYLLGAFFLVQVVPMLLVGFYA